MMMISERVRIALKEHIVEEGASPPTSEIMKDMAELRRIIFFKYVSS